MKIELLLIGRNSDPFIIQGIKEYEKRLKRYIPFAIKYIKDPPRKKRSPAEQKRMEAGLLLSNIAVSDYVILLDEGGMQYSSVQFAGHLQDLLSRSGKKVIFVVGGPYGFDEEVMKRANEKMSLSPMTFSHQIVRLLFMEQIYRAFSIINNDPYHNE